MIIRNNTYYRILYKSILCLLFITTNIVSSKTYYIDSSNGNDLNSGFSISTAWKTISKVNSHIFLPGDSVLFRANNEWREELIIPSSGNWNNPIYFGSYDMGEKPKILGSNRVKKWQKLKNNLWSAEFSNPGCIWFIFGTKKIEWGIQRNSIAELNNNFDFFWTDNNLIIYLDNQKSQNFPIIEASIREFGIISGWYKEGEDHIVIAGLEILFTNNANIRAINAIGWKIQNCEIHHSGDTDESEGQGIQYEGQNGVIQENIIYENGTHGIFLSSFGNSNVLNNIIEKNLIYNNYHTGIDLMNDGGDADSHNHTIIRRNMIYDSIDFPGKEIGIQTLGYKEGLVKNVLIHHNIIVNIKGAGISVVPNSDSIFIHNNTIYETESVCVNIDNNDLYAEVINNVGVNNNYYAVIFVHKSKNKMIDYNVWYTEKNSSTKLAFVENLYFENMFDYQKKNNFDINGYEDNPKLIFNDSFPIQIELASICKSRGKGLNYLSDYYGNKIVGKSNIGAFQ